ncbi:39S ribosomal protein L3, mitochondrial-like [Octopus sinensis]|uniref:Large ribosomal subunit protein uL3m n=1 Tax=Octopus sinensis TaxID=2607531 RepID=A0A6P7TSB6_9MOLL|nr:39S ribosomal protein L3, mitochondrial-like [Octopus sinensis]
MRSVLHKILFLLSNSIFVSRFLSRLHQLKSSGYARLSAGLKVALFILASLKTVLQSFLKLPTPNYRKFINFAFHKIFNIFNWPSTVFRTILDLPLRPVDPSVFCWSISRTKRCGVLAIKIGLLPQWLKSGKQIYTTVLQVSTTIHIHRVDRGFQGVMKRWGFSGGPAGHGSTKFHRRAGAPGKMLKGTKMPGHMGNELVTTLSLQIWRVIPEHDILFVSGPGIPGPNHSFVRVWDCCGAKTIEKIVESKRFPHVPTYSSDDLCLNEAFDEAISQFSEPSIVF